MAKVKGIFHINIVCKDLTRSLHFYCDLLGAKIVANLGEEGTESEELAKLLGFPNKAGCKGHLLRFGEEGAPGSYTTIDLLQWLKPVVVGEPYPSLNHTGITRICLPVDNVNSMVEMLKEAGAEFLSEPVDLPVRLFSDTYSWYRMCCVKDPDGVILELSETLKNQ